MYRNAVGSGNGDFLGIDLHGSRDRLIVHMAAQ
jgi:hypothetical protein